MKISAQIYYNYSRKGYRMDKKLLAIIACPICKGKLVYHKDQQELICKVDRKAFPIRDDIPVMLIEESRELTPEEEY